MSTRISPDPGMYISKLWLRNFRGFRRAQEIPLAPLTFLVGPNSSGKSSLFDAVLLVVQSGLWPGDPDNLTPSWAGPLVDLGSYSDAVYGHKTAKSMEIGMELVPTVLGYPWRQRRRNQVLDYPIQVFFTLRSYKDDPIGRVSKIRIVDSSKGEEVSLSFTAKHVKLRIGEHEFKPSMRLARYPSFRRWIEKEIVDYAKSLPKRPVGRKSAYRRIAETVTSFKIRWLLLEAQRVSSGRAAPKRWYPVTDLMYRPTRFVRGPRVFDTVDPTMLDESRREDFYYPYRRRRPRPRRTLSSILSQLDIAREIRDSKLSPYHHSIDVEDSRTGIVSNIIDVGYGASQVIPVIYACLSDSIGPLFVEQPEIHLHPRAQSVIAELLSATSKHRQVVVETHSVHMINRARILIAQGKLHHADVNVLYVDRSSRGSRVLEIPIGEKGNFQSEWPEGFFDERFQETMLLLDLSSPDDE